jgi:hypothetical protein
MALVTLTVRVAPEELDYLDQLASQHEGILSKQGVVRLLLQHAERSNWDPLDKGGEMAKNLEQPGQSQSTGTAGLLPEISTPPVSLSTRQEKQPKSAAFAAIPLPAELEAVRHTFVQFGKVKKGDRGDHGAKLAATGLRKIGEKYGWDVAREQLDLAINNRWAGISLSNYEKFLPKAAAAAQPETRHPAYRVFTAENGFGDESTTNPVLKDLF